MFTYCNCYKLRNNFIITDCYNSMEDANNNFKANKNHIEHKTLKINKYIPYQLKIYTIYNQFNRK